MPESMKILLLNYEYPPLGGGAGNATAYLLREFRRRDDLRMDVITSSTAETRVEELSDRIRIHFLDIGKSGNLHYQSNKDLLKYASRAYRYARKLMKREQYDLCHAFFGIPCGFLARRLKIPYLVSLRGSDVPFYNERFRMLDRLLFKWISIRIWRDARAVVANSEGLRQLALQSAPWQPILVIPNGVDVEEFHPAWDRPSTAGLRVLCVSRLIPRKRIDLLIQALKELSDCPISLTLVGTGNQESALKELARNFGVEGKVFFKGFVPHEEIVEIYQRHDLFALPSENEGMSNTVLEALACGLPILMTQTGGAEELIQDGQNGYVIEKDSVSDLVDKMRRYHEHQSLLEEHGRRCREIAESLSWSAVADAYVEEYRKVLSLRE